MPKASPPDYCWSLLSVPPLFYHLTLSLPLLSATTSDSLENASIKHWGREVRQSKGIRTSAWWCVNSPSESLMLKGEGRGCSDLTSERVLIAPSPHHQLERGTVSSFLHLSVGIDPGKNGLKIRMEPWRKRAGKWLGFGRLPASLCPLLAVLAALQSFILIPSIPIWLLLLLQLLRWFMMEQHAIRKESELIKLTHYRFNIGINKIQVSE